MTNISFSALADVKPDTLTEDEILFAVLAAEEELESRIKLADQEEEIMSLRTSLMEVALESDMSLVNHYRTALEGIGIDCSTPKSAAEGISAVVEEFNTKALKAALGEDYEAFKAKVKQDSEATPAVEGVEGEEATPAVEGVEGEEAAEDTEVAVEAIEVILGSALISFYLGAMALLVKTSVQINMKLGKVQMIIDKGMKQEAKNTKKILYLLPVKTFDRVIPGFDKVISGMLKDLKSYNAAAAKRTIADMKAIGWVWNGKEYVKASQIFISKMTVPDSGWTPAKVESGFKVFNELFKTLIQAEGIEKQLKAASKEVAKEEGVRWFNFKTSEQANEIKANRKLAGATIKVVARHSNLCADVLLTVAKQFGESAYDAD